MKLLLPLLFVLPALAQASSPALTSLTKGEVRDVAKEVSYDLHHTSVAAPETNGLWGVEVGLVAGRTKSPHLADRVDDAGGKGSDFKNIYGGGAIARVHVPFDLFAELSLLPSYTASDLEVQSRGVGVGWNLGGFFSWPIDVAVGADFTRSKLNFDQTISNVDSTIKLSNKTRTVWVGVSKTFVFVTPYAKVGSFAMDSDVKQDGSSTLFNYTTSSTQNVTASGAFGAIGVDVQLLLFRLGVEASRAAGVAKGSAKFSFAF